MLQLNVVLHGTWGIENNRDAIRIVTVKDDHHVIKAGGHVNPQHDLQKTKYYRLKGATPGAPSSFNPDQNPTIDPKIDFPGKPDRSEFHADEAKVAVVIDVDYPREIHSVRRFKTEGREFFEGNLPRTPFEIADVQVLVYDVEDPTRLELTGSDWTPEINPDGRTINLHLFANPDAAMLKHLIAEEEASPNEEKHFVEVFKNLGTAFGLPMTPLMTVDVPFKLEEPIKGLDVCDTAALFERCNRAASSPANCAMLVLNNRNKPSSTA